MVTINAATLPEVSTPAPPTATPGSTNPVPRAKGTAPAGTGSANIENQNVSPEGEPKVNLEELTQAVDQLEKVAKLANRSVHFRINETGDDIQVLVINEDTEEVIREIPPDAALELAERIQGTLGLLIDKVA